VSGASDLTCPTCKVKGTLDAEARCRQCGTDWVYGGTDWVYENGAFYRPDDLRLACNIDERLRAAEETLRAIRRDSIGVNETFAWRARMHINAYFEQVGEKADP